MVLQKLDLVDEEVITIGEVLRNEVHNEKLAAIDIAHGVAKVIVFDKGDEENAANWSAVCTGPYQNILTLQDILIVGQVKKLLIVTVCLILVFITTLGSSLPSGAIDILGSAFHVTSQRQLTLLVSVFLVGYIFGPIIFSPLSESYGRRLTLLSSFAVYTLFTLACALAPNWPALLLFRFIVGVGASAPPTVLGGLFADIYPGWINRGRAVMLLALATNLGPITGPIISGFVSDKGWRWMFWVNLILTGTMWPILVFLPGQYIGILTLYRPIDISVTETFGPIILLRRVKAMRLSTGNPHLKAPLAIEKRTVKQILTVVLARPVIIISEPIVACVDLFLALEYTIFFLYFEAYPFIFKG